jgi:hypothetical protein
MDISWLVIPIIIDSIKSQSFRATPNIIKKGREIASPFIAHGNAPSTIIFEVFMALSKASAFGFHPYGVFRSPFFCAGVAVSTLILITKFLEVATAAFCNASSQICAFNIADGSAIAFAYPASLMAFIWAAFDYGPSAETLSSEINECWHNHLRNGWLREICAATGTEYRDSGATLAAS